MLGDDTDFVRSEAEIAYLGISRVLPYEELSKIDEVWTLAESSREKGDYKSANEAYLELMDLTKNATPCAWFPADAAISPLARSSFVNVLIL